MVEDYIPSAAELLKWEKITKPALVKATQLLSLEKVQRAAELGSSIAQQEVQRREGLTGMGQDPLRLLRWPSEWGPMPVSPWTRPTGLPAPGVGVQPQFFMSPKGWGFTEDFSTFISPAGEEFTLAEAQTELAHMGFEALVYDYNLNLFVPSTFEFAQAREAQYTQQQVNLAAIGQPGFVAPPGTPGAITIEEYNRRIADIGTMAGEQRQVLTDAFAAVFPGQTIDDFFTLVNDMVINADVMSFDEVAEATELQIEFLETIRGVGRTPGTEFLLQTVFPGIDETGMSELFGAPLGAQQLPEKEQPLFLPLIGQIKKLTAEQKEAAPAWVKAFASGVGDVYSAAAGAARWLGFDSVGQTLSLESERLHREYPYVIEEFEYVREDLLNPEFFEQLALKVTRAVPFALALAPVSIGTYFGGAALASAAGLGAIWSAIVGGITSGVLSRPIESALEAGTQYDDAIARGKTEQEAKEEADEVFRNNMVLAGADAFEIAIALAPTPKWVPAALVKGGLVRTVTVGGKVVIVGLSQGGEELIQDMIQRHARGEEWKLDPVSKEVFAIGAIMGMGMGLGGDVITNIVNSSKKDMSVSQKKGFDAVTEDFKAEGFTQEQAELRALDMMAQSPEGQGIVARAIEQAKRFITEERGAIGRPEGEEVKPPVVPVVKAPVVEPLEVVSEGGVPVSPDEPIPQGVVENIPIIKDVGAKETFRPPRKVFQRMGIGDIHKGIQRAETLIGEERLARQKKIKEIKKLVGKNKERWSLIFDEANEKGSVTGLSFNEKRVVAFIRNWADEWANRKNLPQEKRIKDYIPHLFEQEMINEIKEMDTISPELAMMLSERVPSKITDPFLKERLGALGFIKDPFRAMEAYDAAALRVLYYEPFLQKISLIANDPNVPEAVRGYLKDYSRRMTGEPSKLDNKVNADLRELASKLEKLPGGKRLSEFLSQGNPAGLASYQFTSAIYTLWLGFKPTSAIRNLSQHTLIIGEVGPVRFAEAISKTLTEESKSAVAESVVMRSRKAGFVPGIDDSFASQWVDKFRETALWMFRNADKVNVRHAFLAGYYEAKHLLPNADRQVWIDRGDEVAADTQYLYTKMNSMALSQSAPGRVFSILTTWSVNWIELMTKWVSRRPSQVYLEYQKATGEKVKGANWSTSYRAILMYMAIVGLGYILKEESRLKAWEYTGITSIKYLADVVGGDFPGLQAPGAIAAMIAGFVTDDERLFKEGWYDFKTTFTPGIIRQLEKVVSGDKDWLTLLFYLEGRDFYIKKLKDGWEKGWEDYDALTVGKDRNQYRKDNPLIEAQMFITSKFTTLSSEEARQEVLRLIEKNNLDVELIDGFEKVFGQDTNKKFKEFKGQLGQVELDEAGEQKLKENGELDYFTTSNFASEVNKLEGVVGRAKIEQDGNTLAIEYLRARDLMVQYENLTTADARNLYRLQFPDVEAQLYLWGKISTFKNPKSALVLLDLMEKYNIPPESIPAFLDNPEKYDELFTQRYKLKQKTFDLDTQYENFGNPESTLYIFDSEARKLARAKLKEDNPDWMADNRRIEAIDHRAEPMGADEFTPTEWRGEISKSIERDIQLHQDSIDRYNETGKIPRTGWSLQNERALIEKFNKVLAFINGKPTDWKESDILGFLNVARQSHADSIEWLKAHPTDASWMGSIAWQEEWLEQYSMMIDLIKNPERKSMVEGWVERGRLVDEFGSNSDEAKVWMIDHPDLHEWALREGLVADDGSEWKESVLRLNIEMSKLDTESEEYKRLGYKKDAYQEDIPDNQIDTYVDWYMTKRSGYEDDWFLMENQDFYQTMVDKGIWQERDFSKVPTREQVKSMDAFYELPDAGYDREWYLQENKEYYNNVWLGLLGNQSLDFEKIPTREVYNLYLIYSSLPKGNPRLFFRIENPELDKWGQIKFGWTPATGTLSPDEKEKLTKDEQIASRLAGMGKGDQLLPVFRG